MKRIIAMLLAIVMLVGNVPVQAFATDTEAQETTPCPVEGCTYGAGHTGECSTFVACGKDGCTYAAGHEGNCSSYVAAVEPKVEPAADAAVYVTVSNRGELGMAYEEVTVSDINKDGKLSVDEALYAAHVVYGKGYTSQNGTVTQLWGVETTNISFFVNHSVISTDVCAETIGSGDYLVASVDQDAVNDYDKYSRFNDMEKTVKAGEAFTLTLTDDAGNALAGMEVGLSNGNGSTTMTDLTTDVNGSVTLTLDQEGLYCVTAKGTVVESSIDVNTMEITSIETPIIAPCCVVTVSGTAAQEQSVVYMQEVQSTSRSVAAAAETDLPVNGSTIDIEDKDLSAYVLTTLTINGATVVSATQDDTTIHVILAENTDPSAPLTASFGGTAKGGYLQYQDNSCTLADGSGVMNVAVGAFAMGQPRGQATYTINFTVPMGTAYTVTQPTGDGFTFTGKNSVYEGKDYTFTVSVNEGYDGSNMVVKVNDAEVTGDNGTYTVTAVTEDLTITVEDVVPKERCTVTLTEGEGYTISSNDTPYKGEDYTFTVTPNSVNYKADTLQVLLDGESMLGTDGIYTIPTLAQDHTVTVTIDKKAEYTVTKTGMDGVTITGEDTVLETDPYTFSVSVDNAYDSSEMVVTVNNEPITLADDGSYTIDAAIEDIAIVVTGVKAKVIYDVTLTKGDNYTISGQKTSYAGEPYTFTVTVNDAIYFANQISVKVNGETVTLTEGKYTFEALDGNKTVTVENVVERQLFTVTKPEVAGVTFTGDNSVREGKPYTFSISVDNAYDSTAMEVKVNDQVVNLTDGSYTIASASENIEIEVTGVVKKQVCSITLTEGEGYTVTGAATAYKGDSYTFTVTVATGYVADAMAVTANGETVNGNNGSYTITVAEDTIIVVSGVERAPLPDKELTVKDNVIDITDNTVYSRSSYYAKAVNITVSGATVKKAYEDNTTIYIVLPSNTEDNAQIDVTFGTSVNGCSMSGTTGSLTLTEGGGVLSMTLKGQYGSFASLSGTVLYNLIFIREAATTEVPVRMQETDSAEMYRGKSITLDLDAYFTGEESYYLVESTGNTPVEMRYTFVPDAAGTYTLVFGAANPIGDCPDRVTVTITVKDIESGVWMGYAYGAGSVDSVTITNASGDPIQGARVTFEGTTIQVILPKTYGLTDQVTATFTRTANESGMPFLSTSSAFNQGAESRTDVYTNTLSNGAAKRNVYLYNSAPKATSNNYVTLVLDYSIANDLPILAEGMSATTEATITAGQNYTLDLTNLFTDSDGDAMTYLVSINGAEAVAADAAYSYTTNTAGTYTLVFTANDGKGTSTETYTVTLTVENSTATKSMTVSMPEGLNPKFYVSTGFDGDGIDTLGDEVTATMSDKGYTLTYPDNAEMLSVRTEDWGGMAFAADADGSVTLRQVQMNVVDYDNNPAESTNTVTYDGHTAASGSNGWLLKANTEYTFTAVPKDTSLTTASVKEILQSGEGIYTLEAVLGISNPIAITVPTGATAQLYNYNTNKYYFATELEAKIVKDNEDGTTTYSFIGDTKASGTCFIYRVSMPGKITKAGYLAWGKQTVNVTYTDADKPNTYRLDDYSAAGQANSGLTEDSVLLNINSRNHLAMNVGETKTLKAYRVWEIIKVSFQNYIITPDFTYNILSGSDVVRLTDVDSPSVGEGDWKKLEAIGNGTAVIEVTYDAMEVSGGDYDGIYGASDPARTGLVVVQVGGNDASVDFGIDGFSSRGTSYSDHIEYNENAKRAWDAEFDTLYFTGNSGELKLSPTAAGAITQVAVSHDKGSSWKVLTEQDGVYTAPIVSGNNILRVTTDSGVAYQVVRGDKVTVQITEQSGDGDGAIEPGETARVTLTGLHMPIPKMAGNYNPGFGANSDGYSSVHLNYTVNGQTVYGPGTQYNFITAANYLDIAIPEEIQTDKLTLTDGYIGVGVIGLTQFVDGGDSHRNIPDDGCTTRGSQTTFHTRSILPEITISVEGVKMPVSVTGVTLDQTGLTLNVGETQMLTATVTPENADNKKVTWSSDNLTVVTAVNGVVEAVGAGTATVTVTTEDGGMTATCTVAVTQPVESVTVTPETAEVEVGKTVQLTAAVLPENASDKTVTWTSGDEAIATVANGTVTGVKAGTVTITAKAGDQTSTCTVTVKEIPEADVDVYLSVSHDAEFLTAENTGKVMALQKVRVPYFDLTPYGLGEFNLPESHADYGKPTMLHLYIYATEVFQYGVSADEAGKGYLKNYIGSDMFAVSGAPGSICLDKFWGYDMNLNYYHNYVFPADESGYGITADSVVLKDGDIVTIGHFTSWSFFGDSTSIFNYLVADGDTVVTTAAQNDALMLQVYRAGPNLGTGGSNTPVEAVRDIYYAKADSLTSGDVTTWTKLGTTDETGKLEADISDLPVGQYILAVAGQKGVEYPNDIVSTPGGIILNVTESTLSAAVRDVIDKINAIGEVTPEKADTIAAARSAYEALPDADKAMVSNYAVLQAAEDTLEEIRQGQAAIQTVMDKINAIGDVTVDSETKIQEARDAYRALTDAQKNLVANYDTLTAAEATLAALKATEADKAEAKKVVDQIESIDEVSLEKETAINEVREAYDRLTEAQKNYVSNYDDLLKAEETLRLLKLSNADIVNIYQTTGNYLAELEAPGVASINGEWRVIGLSRAGRSVPDAYYDAVVAYVKENIDADGRLHTAKSSDNSRVILALTAIGKDVTAVGGYDLLSGLDNMEYIGNQGINGYIWALLAFDSHAYQIPAGDVTREKLVNAILTEQLADGGWALAGNVSDPDMTGMALAALAPYRSDPNVAAALEKALECLSDMQNEDGTFSSITEGVTCESLAQVITGLTALGINPETDSRFIKNGVSAVDALSAFYVDGGGFKHGMTGSRNMMATEQAYYALVSYYRLLQGKTSLYDMSDVKLDKEAAAEVDALINAIGTVTANSGASITAAREAYEALDDTLKPFVEYLSKLQNAEKAYDQLMAKKVMDKIDAIGEVTLESEQAIKDAADAYEALTDIQKDYVTNYEKLTAAQKAWADLKSTEADRAKAAEVKALIAAIGQVTLDSEAQILAAREAYEALTDVQKPYVDNLETLKTAEKELTDLKDQKAADDVERLIDNIGQVELTTACENAINAARRAYNALTTIQKGMVNEAHIKTLTEAEDDLAALKDQAAADAVKQKIDAIGSTITLGSETKIKDARNAYNKLTAAQKNLVSNYLTLLNAETALNALKSTVSVTFSLLGCYKHGTGETTVHTLAGGNLQTWIAAKTYSVQPGATVKDLFEQALTAAGLTWKNPTGNYVESITRNGVTIGEFTNGSNSGWMYTLNGKHPGLGVNQQTLVNGDKVVFHYTDDYTKEEDSISNSGTTTSGTTNYITTTSTKVNTETAESVERLIDDIDEEITLDSEAKITAARAAYDKLTEEQKKLVENYDKLLEAEAALAELKGGTAENIYIETGDYIQGLGTPGVGNVGGEWMVIGLARSGRPVPSGYYDHVLNYVRENINDAEQLHSAKSSDNSRLILALTAIGKDVTNVDGHDLLEGLNNMDYIQKQGINGPIWALLAFDSGNYPVPEGNVSREKLIDVILEAQLSDGGWALSGERADPDMTAMAIQALAAYMDSDMDVKNAIDNAIRALSEMQNDNGSFTSVDGPNSESIAQVIVALAALGIDADTDARFVKNGISALDALLTYYIPGGGFRHILDGNLDGMATEQAYYALVAYNRMLQNQNFLYDMTDVIDMGGDVIVEESTVPTQVSTEPVEEEEGNGNTVVIWTSVMTLCAGVIIVILLNRKKLFGKFM